MVIADSDIVIADSGIMIADSGVIAWTASPDIARKPVSRRPALTASRTSTCLRFAGSQRLCDSPSCDNQVEGFLQDLAHSVRMFRRSPGFTLAAVAAITLGIGMNTAIFTVANAVLLKPVPFPDPDRLVMLMVTSRQGAVSWASPARFALWRTQTSVIQDVTAFRTDLVNLTSGDKPEQLRAGQVSADYFRLFGAPILQGRSFSADEDRPNGDTVV